MPYAFEYQAFDRKKDADAEDYNRKDKEVTVVLQAEDEEAAQLKAMALVDREVFKLQEIVELSEDLMPIKASTF